MLYLRLFLIYPDVGGDLNVQISSEFEEFRRQWDDLISHEDQSALIHVGFTRPDNEDIIQTFRRNPGKILFTSSAVNVLASLLQIKTSFLESLYGESFYALGESASGATSIESLSSPVSDTDIYPEWVIHGNSFNWFRGLDQDRPDITSIASQVGIKDDLSYQLLESKLPLDIRVELAFARSVFIKDIVRLSRIKDLPRILPPWVLHNSIDIFNFSVRTRKRLELQKINKVSDFALYTDEQLLQIPGVGRNVINEIRSSLSDYATLIMSSRTALLGSLNADNGVLLAGASRFNASKSNSEPDESNEDKFQPQEDFFDVAESGNLLEKFGLLAAALTDVQQTVIYHRSGLDGSPKTLQEVAFIIDTTRERVRQIQKKASEILTKQGNMGMEIRRRIDEVRRGMVVPLKISSLPTYDAWFQGCDKNPFFFEFILDLFQYAEPHKSANYIISNYQNLGIILKGDIDTLGRSVKDLIDFIKNNLNTGVTKAQIKEKIENFAAVDTPELVDFIFYEVTEHAIFSPDANGDDILIFYGQGIEAQIVDALSHSNAPMNVSDIADYIREKYNPLVEIEYIRNNCLANTYLFARSTYGLKRHLHFSDLEIEEISDLARAHMESLPQSRQWRSNEILEEIPQLVENYEGRLNHYTLAIILELSGKFTGHGKMLFSLSDYGDEARAKRVEFLDLVEAALEGSDRPLTRAEIYALVSKERGLSSSAQIHPIGNIVSCGRGLWGLLDKHLGLTSVDFEIIVEDLVNVFKKVKQGLDYEELVSRLVEGTKAWQLRNTPVILFSLGAKSKKFKVSDIFLYPANWPGPFRTTQRMALEQAYEEIPMDGMSLTDVLDNACLKYGHPIVREVAYGAIRDLGGFHDESTGRWFKKID